MSSEPQQKALLEGDDMTVSFTSQDLLVYFLRLGALGFGGPLALAGYIEPVVILPAGGVVVLLHGKV